MLTKYELIILSELNRKLFSGERYLSVQNSIFISSQFAFKLPIRLCTSISYVYSLYYFDMLLKTILARDLLVQINWLLSFTQWPTGNSAVRRPYIPIRIMLPFDVNYVDTELHYKSFANAIHLHATLQFSLITKLYSPPRSMVGVAHDVV